MKLAPRGAHYVAEINEKITLNYTWLYYLHNRKEDLL